MLSHNDPGRLGAVHSVEQRPLCSKASRGGAVHRLVASRGTEATSWAKSIIALLVNVQTLPHHSACHSKWRQVLYSAPCSASSSVQKCQQLKLPLCGESAVSHAGCWPSRVVPLHTLQTVCDRALTYVARSSRSQLYCSLSRPVPLMSPSWSLADVSPTYADRVMKCTAPTCGGTARLCVVCDLAVQAVTMLLEAVPVHARDNLVA